jgi:hypothetical protein
MTAKLVDEMSVAMHCMSRWRWSILKTMPLAHRKKVSDSKLGGTILRWAGSKAPACYHW